MRAAARPRAPALAPCRAPRHAPAARRAASVAAKKADGPVVAIVGVTGAVGQEFLKVGGGGGLGVPTGRWGARWRRGAGGRRGPAAARGSAADPSSLPRPQVLKERDFPYSRMKLLASAR